MIGKARHLFINIKIGKPEKWRQLFDDEEARRLEEEEAVKKDKRKAFAKARKVSK